MDSLSENKHKVEGEMAIRKDDNIVVGIGCYKREEWEQFLVLADDREKLEDT